ncbi:MAG TPA: hypothetical protein PKG95_15355, partial [Anaerolineaceae bacterium]|nr:hypothetical protein [Anaerolineaceae bacterium]
HTRTTQDLQLPRTAGRLSRIYFWTIALLFWGVAGLDIVFSPLLIGCGIITKDVRCRMICCSGMV